MQKPQSDITGCRFTLYPMTDNYAEVILGALKQTDVSKVWQQTDHMSTLYIGRQSHVVDCANAVFAHCFREGLHMGGEFTFSKAGHYDVGATEDILQADDALCNAFDGLGDFPAYAKVSIYAFGVEKAAVPIQYVGELAARHGLQPKVVPLVTMLKGSSRALFTFFDEVLTYARENIPFYVLQATVSVNSPTPVDW